MDAAARSSRPSFHGLFLDGVFVREDDGTRTFHEAPRLTDEDVAKVARRIWQRVLRRLRL